MYKINRQTCTKLLFIIYIFLLTWLVLFKFNTDLSNLGPVRNINLTLYIHSQITNEMKFNVIAFIPCGIYISMLKFEWGWVKKVFPIVAMSLLFEILQYVLMIGITDITDLVGNTLGGCIGIGVFYAVKYVFKDKMEQILNIVALFSTLLTVSLIVFLRCK